MSRGFIGRIDVDPRWKPGLIVIAASPAISMRYSDVMNEQAIDVERMAIWHLSCILRPLRRLQHAW